MHRFRNTLLQPGVDLRSTHPDRLVRWLGQEAVSKMSNDMRGWPGPPIAVHGVPGAVFATGDGDFIGRCEAGQFGSALDRAGDILARMRRQLAWRVSRGMRVRHGTLYAGFASLSELIADATAGKRWEYQYSKVGPTGVANVTSALWRLGNQPAAGGAPGAAPGGTAFTDATVGGHPFTNPVSGDTQHIVGGMGMTTVAGNSALLYDQIFGVVKTINSTATEAVTGVPTRYQNQAGGTADYIGGNFLFVLVGGTALAATAHNWTVCQYTDQDGTTAVALPSLTGNASAIVDRLDHPVNQWYAPLATGDTGVKALTQMQCSALVATGVIWFMMGHPICWMPLPIANLITPMDYVQTAFNLTRIFDDACLALLEVNKPSATAATYNIQYSAVAG